ncbi:MAG: ATP-binding protein [Bryobacteraceae bacterium]|jgi:signal transduction histidine kinase
MSSLLWQLVDHTVETEFIFALFHLLLTGVGSLILLRWIARGSQQLNPPARLLLSIAFVFFALDFASTATYYGMVFFFDRHWNWLLFRWLSGSLTYSAMVLSAAGLVVSECQEWFRRVTVFSIGGCFAIVGLPLLHFSVWPAGATRGVSFHTVEAEGANVLATLAVATALVLLIKRGRRWREPALLTLLFLLGSGLAQPLRLFLDTAWSNLWWHVQEHLLSFGLVTFVWTLGEYSENLFDRVFVRLNLSFILLGSLMLLSTVGMERFQYIRLAEERSLNLGEYLRGYLAFYEGRGEKLETVLQRPEVLRRIVVGFSEVPDFQRVEISLGGDHAAFHYSPDGTISEQVGVGAVENVGGDEMNEDAPLRTSFRMLQIPVFPERENRGRIEFYGGMQYINRRIGSYIVVVYLLFTVTVTMSIIMVGVIVRNADFSMQKQHAKIEDISRQLLNAAKLASIGELAGGVAHEINNPVTGILSTSTHLIDKRRDTSLTARDKRDLQLIAEQAERISDIVSKLLTFSRQSRMELVLCDVNTVIEKAISLIEFRLRGSDVVLDRELDTDLPPVLCDPNRLTEVFVNLMNNAIDAMNSAGTLTVASLRTADGHVRIAVSDTGCGIDPALMQRIFDPFFTTKGPGKGTGLGLSISHGIVRGHQGEIHVHSRPDHGATFSVVLPARVS